MIVSRYEPGTTCKAKCTNKYKYIIVPADFTLKCSMKNSSYSWDASLYFEKMKEVCMIHIQVGTVETSSNTITGSETSSSNTNTGSEMTTSSNTIITGPNNPPGIKSTALTITTGSNEPKSTRKTTSFSNTNTGSETTSSLNTITTGSNEPNGSKECVEPRPFTESSWNCSSEKFEQMYVSFGKISIGLRVFLFLFSEITKDKNALLFVMIKVLTQAL